MRSLLIFLLDCGSITAFISERRWKRQTVRGMLLKVVSNGNKLKKKLLYIFILSSMTGVYSIMLKQFYNELRETWKIIYL